MQERTFKGYIIPFLPLLPPEITGFRDISLVSFGDKNSFFSEYDLT